MVWCAAAMLVGLALPAHAQAASLSLSPNAATHKVGETFAVTVRVSSSDQAINAASSTIRFPTDKLQVVGLGKSNSIIDLWVREPAYDNTQGRVTFEGIVLNPGYQGASGSLITISFRAKAIGTASVTFASASVLANDGKGTNILTAFDNADFTIAPTVAGPTAPESSSPTQVIGAPAAVSVASTTHPDPNKWYSNSNPAFSWVNPSGTLAARILSDHEPTTTPSTQARTGLSSWTYQNVDDGVWYFHLRLQNSYGWGAVSHFRFQIDTVAPQPFTIKFTNSADTTNPTPTVTFATTDQTSGIAYYRLKIGDAPALTVAPADLAADGSYTLPPQTPGHHTLVVQAFDQAGNYAVAAQDFDIAPLNQPQLTQYPSELAPSDDLVVKGTTYPSATVRLTLQPQSGATVSETVTSDAQGNFTVVWPKKLDSGTYQFEVQAMDQNGAQSTPTDARTVLVREKPFLRIGQLAISYLTLVVTFASLLLMLIFVVSYAVIKVRHLRKTLRREVGRAETVLHRSFRELREDIAAQLKLLERVQNKRELTAEEAKLMRHFQKVLNETEQVVDKEMEHLEKDIG